MDNAAREPALSASKVMNAMAANSPGWASTIEPKVACAVKAVPVSVLVVRSRILICPPCGGGPIKRRLTPGVTSTDCTALDAIPRVAFGDQLRPVSGAVVALIRYHEPTPSSTYSA